MIKMFSINDFDNFEKPNNLPESADGDVKSDEFSALLSAFSFVPAEIKAPVLPPAKPEIEASENARTIFPENIQTVSGDQKAPENNKQIVNEENPAEQNSMQTFALVKSVPKISADNFSLNSKNIIGQKEDLPALQTAESESLTIENKPRENFLEAQFSERKPAKFNFYIRSDAEIKPVQNTLQPKDFQFSNSEYDVVVREFPQEDSSIINSNDVPVFARKNDSTSYLLPELFRDIAKDLKKANPVKAFEQSGAPPETEPDGELRIDEKNQQAEITEIKPKDKQNPASENSKTGLKDGLFNSDSASKTSFKNNAKISLEFSKIKNEKTSQQISPETLPVENLIDPAAETNREFGETQNLLSKIQKNVSEFAAKIEIFNSDLPEKKVFKPNLEAAENSQSALPDKFLFPNGNEAKTTQNAASFITSAQSEKVFEQISARLKGEILIFTEKADKTNILKMRLRPAELGAVEIRLEKGESGNLRAHFQTETEAARQILVERSEQLREALQNSGWQIEKLDISCNSFSSTGESERRDAQSRHSEEIENASSVATNFDDESEKMDGSTSNRLVNLRA